MIQQDLPFALKATDLEGWGYTQADFKRLLHLDPGGCLKAVVGGKKVGITTATSYGRVGWIGNVVVLPRYRKRDIGTQLVLAGMEYLEKKGAKTIRLNSYLHTVRFYEELDFRREFENIRFHGVLRAGKPGGRKALAASLERIAAFDRCFFGCSRLRLLSALHREFPDTFLALDEDGVKGYLVGQVGNGACEIAPWVSDPRHPGSVAILWRELRNRLPGKRVAFTATSLSGQALSLARKARMERGLRTLRMYHGRRANRGRPEGILALGGLEKG